MEALLFLEPGAIGSRVGTTNIIDILLDSWVFICIASFVSFAVATDRRNRNRKRMLNACVTVDELMAKDEPAPVLPSSLSRFMNNTSSASSINRENTPSGLSYADSSLIQSFSYAESPLRLPRVNFGATEIGEDANASFNIGPQVTLQSTPLSDQTKSPDSRKSLFIPFVGRRLHREHSNASVMSAASILRSPTSLLRASPKSLLPLLPIRINGEDISGSTNNLRSPTGGSSRNSSPLDSEKMEIKNIALDRDECGICFTLLHKEEIAVCCGADGTPTCLHVYHHRCLKVLRHRRCLFCGVRFKYRRKVPDVEFDPKGWFEIVDVNKSNGLSLQEITRVLAAQLPIDRKALEKMLAKNWHKWDADKSGEVDQEEFFATGRGLLRFIKKHRATFKLVDKEVDPPDIRDDPREWFDYFDHDRSGMLDRYEVLRGLILSFKLHRDARICLNLRAVIDAVWPVFDVDANGAISRHEFTFPKTGLSTSIVTSLEFSEKGRRFL